GHHDRASRRQARQIGQLGQAVLARPEQELVARKGWLEAVRGARIGANGLHAEANHRRLLAEPARQLDRDARRVWASLVGVQEGALIVRAAVPAGAKEQPAALGQWAVLTLPFLDMADFKQKIGIAGAFGTL